MNIPSNQQGPYTVRDPYGRTSLSAASNIINAQINPMDAFNQASAPPYRKSLFEIGQELQERLNRLPGGSQGMTITYIPGKENAPDMSAQFARAAPIDPSANAPQMTTSSHQMSVLEKAAKELNERFANMGMATGAQQVSMTMQAPPPWLPKPPGMA